MWIQEVSSRLGMTKKAIYYYEEKGLITPQIEENGYRRYSQEDLKTLEKIRFFRFMGISVGEIQKLLSTGEGSARLLQISRRIGRESEATRIRGELLERYSRGENWDSLEAELEALERRIRLQDKLENAFPGDFGRMLSIQFGPFLQDPVDTEEKNAAYLKIQSLLDQMPPLVLSAQLQRMLEEVQGVLTDELIQKSLEDKEKAYEDFDQFFSDHEESIREYLKWKETPEYKELPIIKLQEKIQEYLAQENGFYEVFLPNLRILSPAYEEHYQKMLRANEKLLDRLGE